MTPQTKTLEVHRIERISSDSVALYLREPSPGSDPAMAYGGEHRLVVPTAEEKPTGTLIDVTYELPVA